LDKPVHLFLALDRISPKHTHTLSISLSLTCLMGGGVTGVTRGYGHTQPLGWSFAPRTSPTVGPYAGACPEFRVTHVERTQARAMLFLTHSLSLSLFIYLSLSLSLSLARSLSLSRSVALFCWHASTALCFSDMRRGGGSWTSLSISLSRSTVALTHTHTLSLSLSLSR